MKEWIIIIVGLLAMIAGSLTAAWIIAINQRANTACN